MIEEFFFDRVAVEARDRARPPGDGVPGAAAGFKVAGEAFNVGAAGLEQPQLMLLAPASVLAQVQVVALAGQPPYPARNPAKASRSVPVNTGAAGASTRVRCWSMRSVCGRPALCVLKLP